MIRRSVTILIPALAAALLMTGAIALAQTEPPMHMHKSDMVHKTDAEAAKSYKDEATVLREKSESHRKLAQSYRGRGPGKVDYTSIAIHCERLAKLYEDAAKEADAVSSELNK